MKPKKTKVLAVTFDPESRREYLTGFHKRKLQRQRKAEQIKKDLAREELRSVRRMKREQKRELLKAFEQAVEEHDTAPQQSNYNEGKITVTVSELEF